MTKKTEHKAEEPKHEEHKTAEHSAAKPSSSAVEDGKTIAIISYLWWVGLLIAFIMNNDKKNDFAKFHIRQSLLLTLASIALWFVWIVPVLGWIIGFVCGIGILVFWIMGLISAINGEQKELPLVGKYAQEWFKGL